MHFNSFGRLAIIAAGTLAAASWGLSPVLACYRALGWTATLVSVGSNHLSRTEKASAQMLFDAEKPIGTLVVDARGVRNVNRIELRAARRPGDVAGPVLAVIYTPKDGPFTGKVSKHLTAADLVDVPSLNISGPGGVATAISQGHTVVTVCTQANPRGELAGAIGLHSIVAYSNGTGSFHDSKLHQAKLAGR
jgi:hypothetical protein